MASFLRIVPCLPTLLPKKWCSPCTCGAHTLTPSATRPSSWHTGPKSRANSLALLCQQRGPQICWFPQFLRKNQLCQVILQRDGKHREHHSVRYSFHTSYLTLLDLELDLTVLPHNAGVLGGPSVVYHHLQWFMSPPRCDACCCFYNYWETFIRHSICDRHHSDYFHLIQQLLCLKNH